MKMRKTDIGVVVFMYAVCAFFYYHMTKLKASSQTYPRFTIILLFTLLSCVGIVFLGLMEPNMATPDTTFEAISASVRPSAAQAASFSAPSAVFHV